VYPDKDRGEGWNGHLIRQILLVHKRENLAGTLNLPGFFGNENHFVKTTTIKKPLASLTGQISLITDSKIPDFCFGKNMKVVI
jgi:hypothetical protein